MEAITEYIRPLVNIEHYVDDKPKLRKSIMHIHNVNELLFFISGDATYMVEGSEYKLVPGCVMFMRAGEAHMLKVRSSVPYERIVLQFADNYFSDVDPDGKILSVLKDKPLGFSISLSRIQIFAHICITHVKIPLTTTKAIN